MSFAIPKLQDLLDRTRNAFRASLPGSDAWVWPNNIMVSAKVIAGSVFELFGFASYISRMIFASTAPDLETLLLHGKEYGLPLRPAAPAGGTVRIATTGDCSALISSVFRRADGVEYISSTAVSRTGAGSLDVPVVAEADGAAANADDGTPVEIVSGVSDADATAAVYGDITSGLDVEDKETYRQRILFRKRNPPHGGSASDYVLWAGSVSGVTRVFVERLWNGVGTVRVFPLMDSLYVDGIPGSGDLDRVASFIEMVRPSGARVSVQAPVAVPIDVEISDLSPDTTAVREAITAELRDAFRRRSRVAGGDTPHSGMPFLATPATFFRSWIDQAVSEAAGEESHVLVSPADDTELEAGEMAVLGDVTFS